jgi:hypothetical protein
MEVGERLHTVIARDSRADQAFACVFHWDAGYLRVSVELLDRSAEGAIMLSPGMQSETSTHAPSACHQ